MIARSTIVLLLALLVTTIQAQDKPPRETPVPTAGEPSLMSAPAVPAPGIPLPTNIQQENGYVVETPVYPQYKQCCIGGCKAGCCKAGCCPKVCHCVHEVVHWLFYKPLPIPHHCACWKHPVSGCTPDVTDFFVQRYGYYNWGVNCPR